MLPISLNFRPSLLESVTSIVNLDIMATALDEKSMPATASPPGEHRDAEFSASEVSLEKDDAIGLVGEHAQEIDPVVEARVLKKIDLFLIPAMIVGKYILSKPLSSHP